MTKAQCLAIEAAARTSVGQLFNCVPNSTRVAFPNGGAKHEFDIYAPGLIIGGVSTSPLSTSCSNRNTGGCDRACSELLWLTLWPGPERRIHVLTDLPLATWLVTRFQGVAFPRSIFIYHYDLANNLLTVAGTLAA